MKHLLLTFCLVIRFLSGSYAQSPFDSLPTNNPLRSALDSAVQEGARGFFSDTKAPGLEIAVSMAGKRFYYAYGYADLASKRSFDSTVIVEAGSITKTFTANLALQLQVAGIIDTAQTVAHYLPFVKGNDSVLGRIRLADLATHHSGLPRLPDNIDRTRGFSQMQPYVYTREDLYQYLSGARLQRPGQYAYSNLGFGLLATVLETASGKSYGTLLRQYILEPLHMRHTYTQNREFLADTATGYFNGRPAQYWTFESMAGAGAIKTNATDMLRYLEAHLSPLRPPFDNIHSALTTPQHAVSPAVNICYGWHTMERTVHRAYWHNGGTYGFSTFAAFEPEHKLAFFAASNSFNVNAALDRLSGQLITLLVGKK